MGGALKPEEKTVRGCWSCLRLDLVKNIQLVASLKQEFVKSFSMGSVGQSHSWSRWTCVFISLLFQASITYVLFTVYFDNCKQEKQNDHPMEVLTISDNHSLVTENPSKLEYLMPTESPNPVIILLWTWPSGHTFPLNQCPPSVKSSGCVFTRNRSMYSIASAVVMNHRDISMSVSDLLPMPRPPGQYWIWFNMEPPQHLRNLTLMENIFNLTMSYRLDSDIIAPYGWIEKNDGTENFTIPRKTKLVAWAASNWNPVLRRIQYYNQLKNYIQVDVYGKNNLELPKEKIFKTLSEYKFYLSFENYAHEDYITEKLWFNAFVVGTVPVVMGPPRKNYERFIPPDSFIHVEDFSSPQELASYLLSLDRDDERYYKYFNWRANYKPSRTTRSIWVTQYCKVCKALKEAPPYRTIPSIVNWFK